jgi:hypothetical protein
LDVLNFLKYDSISVSEYKNLYYEINLYKFDSISVSEYRLVENVVEVNVYKNISVAEDLNCYIGIEINEFNYVMVAEYESVTKILNINEYNSVTITEYRNLFFPILTVDKYDSISNIEDINLYMGIDISLIQNISIIEDFDKILSVNIDVYNSIGHTEFIFQYLDILNFNIYDSISHTEILTINEYYWLYLISVYDSIGHTENISTSWFTVFYILNVYDSVRTISIYSGQNLVPYLYRFYGNKTNEGYSSHTLTTYDLDYSSADYKFGGACADFDNNGYATSQDQDECWGNLCNGNFDETLSFWVKVPAVGAVKPVFEIHKTNANPIFAFWCESLGSNYWWLYSKNSAGAIKINISGDCDFTSWTHVVIFIGADKYCAVFINGVRAGYQEGFVSAVMPSASGAIIGANWGATTFLTGKINDFCIYIGDFYGVADHGVTSFPLPVTEFPNKDTANVAPYWLNISVNDSKTITENIATGVA